MSIFDRIFGRGFGQAAAPAEAPEEKPVETAIPSGKALPAGMERPAKETHSTKKVRKSPDVFYLHKSGKKLSVEEFADYREAIRQRNRLDLKKVRQDLQMYQAPEAEPELEEEPSWNVQPEEIVFAKAKSGEIEAGWQVEAVEGGIVSLSRRDPAEPERKLEMTATREELQKINERGKIDFLQAENWPDLYKLISHNGLVTGAATEYRPTKLKALVEKIRSRKLSPRNITSANNLRQAVEKILAKEPKLERPKPEAVVAAEIFPQPAAPEPAGIIAAGVENIPVEKATAENALKALKLKELMEKSAALDKELAAAAPVNDNPDNYPLEELKEMRHSNPVTIAAASFDVPKGTFDPEAFERSFWQEREARQLAEAKAEQERAAAAEAEKQAEAKAAEVLAAVVAYQRQFGITAADLKKIEGFEKLTAEQKNFVLHNLRKTVIAQFAQQMGHEPEAVIFPAAEEIKGVFSDVKIAEHLAKQPGALDLRQVTFISGQVLHALSGKTEGVINLVGLQAENIGKDTLKGLIRLRTGFLLNDEALRRIEQMDRKDLVEEPARSAAEENDLAVSDEKR